MTIHIITVFPKLLESPLNESIIKRGQEKGLVKILIHNLRDYSEDKHKNVDDYPYGGAPGMILKPEPIFNCLEAIIKKYELADPYLIFMTPQGQTFNQQKAITLAEKQEMIILCGHYKGVDERVREYWKMDEISIGDYVTTGGELPALVVVDAIVRLIPGVISDLNSARTDSFYNNRLDSAYYTRPEEYRGMKVPEVLLSGHHAKIEQWQKQKALERTRKYRQDLLALDLTVENNENNDS